MTWEGIITSSISEVCIGEAWGFKIGLQVGENLISLNFMTNTELSESKCFQVPDPWELKAEVFQGREKPPRPLCAAVILLVL